MGDTNGHNFFINKLWNEPKQLSTIIMCTEVLAKLHRCVPILRRIVHTQLQNLHIPQGNFFYLLKIVHTTTTTTFDILTMETLCKPFLCRWRNLLGRHFVILNLSHMFCHQISINKVLFLKRRETS